MWTQEMTTWEFPVCILTALPLSGMWTLKETELSVLFIANWSDKDTCTKFCSLWEGRLAVGKA